MISASVREDLRVYNRLDCAFCGTAIRETHGSSFGTVRVIDVEDRLFGALAPNGPKLPGTLETATPVSDSVN